ncbi:diaminopimelate epimerase [Chloroflexota bacterium]
MNFTKMQGTGNDFIVVETSDAGRDWAPLAIAMCNRHFGIGGDGLLLAMPSDTADCRMRIFNADGSEAEACGNGLRCLVRYIADKGLVDTKVSEIRIETLAGVRHASLHRDRGEPTVVQVGMGKPEFAPEKIPVKLESSGREELDIILDYPVAIDGKLLPLSFASMGNPHAVYFWEKPVADFPLSRMGPEVEHHPMFPHGTNFEVARIISRDEIEARVWERGVGETLACGTGICAVAVTARLHGYIDKKVNIKVSGGTLGVEWDGVGEVFLSGPAEVVFTGDWTSEV